MRSIDDAIIAFKGRYGNVRVGRDGCHGGSRIKINCVVMKNVNDDKMSDFVTLAKETYGGDVDVRFIKWMPFNDNGWNASRFVSYRDMMDGLLNGGAILNASRTVRTIRPSGGGREAGGLKPRRRTMARGATTKTTTTGGGGKVVPPPPALVL
jgi:molybdenum cofactor biosynthesis enzyme MoaA